jgi:hypothetical protein
MFWLVTSHHLTSFTFFLCPLIINDIIKIQ